MSDVLTRIVATRRARIDGDPAERPVPLAELRRQAEALPPPVQVLTLLRRAEGAADTGLPTVIAEFKRRSPSAGWLAQDADPVAVVAAYRRGGARMASVLTDGPFFGGALGDLASVASAGQLPALRKDFLLDEYDLYASRAAGAAAVLLIARLFPDAGELRALIAATAALHMTALVEAHTVAEALAARAAGALLIGINHRDLATLHIDLALSAGLRGELGAEPVLVAESGLRSGADLVLMAQRGLDAVLVGEALMKQPDPGAALERLLGDARALRATQAQGLPLLSDMKDSQDRPVLPDMKDPQDRLP